MSRLKGVVAAIIVLATCTTAQVGQDVAIYAQEIETGKDMVLRVSRKLTVLSATPAPASASLGKGCGIALDATGIRWVAASPLGPTQLMRIDAQGAALPGMTLSHNPLEVVAGSDGRVFTLTRIPLLSPGPLYCVGSGGLQWANWDGPSLYTVVYPRRLCMTSAGQLWMGDVTPEHGGFWAKPLLLRIDPDDGSIVQSLRPEEFGPTGDEGLTQLEGTIDGTFWAFHAGAPDGISRLLNSDGEQILNTVYTLAGFNGATWDMRVDGLGRLHIVSLITVAQGKGAQIYRYDPANPEQIDATFYLGGVIQGFGLGATGEDVFAVVAPHSALTTRRLERLNLVTGLKSSVSLAEDWLDLELPYGDVSGFIWANVVDRNGDSDGDGASNGMETGAGSNAFDNSSRPDGPKVYLSFALSNGAPILKFVDPDGILNPTGGLHVPSLSLVSSQHGEIFPFLLPFLTFVQVSPDFTEVTALFGGLPIAPDSKWQFEATVADKTGATGWDWQVTRPGNL